MEPMEMDRVSAFKKSMISCILQKLNRMNLQELREVYAAAAAIMERKKNARR